MEDIDLLSRRRIVKDINKNFLVEASAGSGKTTSLVERMVAMVESGIKVEEIIAITFTKKAANEFYERFYKRLYERSLDTYMPSKYEVLPLPTSKSKESDKEALKNIDLCFLGTIDSFCNSVLKEHPFDANIPSTSDIVSDRNDLIPYIDNFLDKLRIEGYRNMDLMDLIHHKDNLYQLIFHMLENRDFSFKFDRSDSPLYESKLEEFDDLFDKFKSLLSFIASLPIEAIKAEGAKKVYISIKNNINHYINISSHDLKNIYQLKYLKVKGFNYHDKLSNYSIPNDIKDFILTPVGEKAETYYINKDEYDKLFNLFDYFIYIKTLAFLNSIKDKLVNYLRISGQLQFIDNLIYLNELLKNKDKGERILNSIRNKHKYYLIDEFQDTSPLQIEIFFRLSSNEYKEDYNDIIPIPGSLFMVGDPKQSIYRFKGADFETYSKVKNKLLSNPKIGEVLYLTNNFRSCLSLCKYFNKLFHEQEYLKDIPNKQSKCDALPLENKIDNDELSNVFTYVKSSEVDDYIYIANLIKAIKENSKGSITYKDFMVIPKNKSHIGEYKNALMKLGINSFSEGSVVFKGSLYKAVIKCFKKICLEDNLSSYEILESIFNINIDKLDNNVPLESHLSNLITLPNKLDYPLPSLLLEKLISNEYLLSYFGVEGLDLLIYLLNNLRVEESKGNVSSYLDAINYLVKLININKPERIPLVTNDLDVVRIANIHKVKGLENKIVILVNPSNREPPKKDASKYLDHNNHEETLFKLENANQFNVNIIANKSEENKELIELENSYLYEEKKRLFYVAATRAKNTLLISKGDKSPWKELYDGVEDNDFPITPSTILEDSSSDATPINVKELTRVNNITNNKSVTAPSYICVSPSESKTASFKSANEGENIVRVVKDSKLFGTLVHKLMECIVKAKDKKLDINKCNEIVNEYQAEDYLSLLINVYKKIYSGGYHQVNGFIDDLYKEIVTSECYSEVPISYKEDNKIIFGYIDLLLIKDNKYTIIDYKTDKNINTDHSKQLELYIKALKNTLGVDAKAFIYNIAEN